MHQSLVQRVESVRTAARRLVFRYGLARFGAAVVAVTVGLGLIDYLLRPHDALLRAMFSAAAAGLAIWAFVRLCWPALCFRPSRVATARQIERRFPALRERLSSAISFAGEAESDGRAGSPELRRAVIAEAEALSVDMDFRGALDQRAVRGAVAMAAAVAGISAILALVNPAAAGLAVARLAQPWRELPWPRRHELEFAALPTRFARGEDFEFAIVDRRGVLPEHVQLLIRQETPGGWRTEAKEMKLLDNRMVFRLDNVTRAFEYRARGGDDDTLPWTELTVVDPPKIVDLEVLADPPAYTGLAQQSAGRVVSTVVGSRLRLRGTLDQPIRSALIKPVATDFSVPAVEVAADGRHFIAPGSGGEWTVNHSGAFWFELTDQHGMTFGRDTRMELHALPDTPPSIAWDSPGDHSFVTRRAMVTVKGAVKDDLAVRSLQLRYMRPGQSDEEQVVDIYTGQNLNTPGKATMGGESRRFEYGWELSNLAGLAAGDVLAVRITAEDYQPQLSTTTVRRLTIITEEDLDNRIAARQTAILGQLADALRVARQCREQTESLAIRLNETEQLTAGDIQLLQAAQHNQRQVERLLGATSEGAEGQITALVDELAANRAAKQASGQRLNDLLTQVHAINQGPIPAIGQELTEAIKAAGEATSDRVAPQREACDGLASDVPGRLQSAAARQEDVVQSLERIVGTLTEWDNFSRIAREVGQIRADQERLAAETDDLMVKDATAVTGLSAADRATARQLSQRELELGRRLDKLQTRMEEMLRKLTAEDPLTAAALADALDAARRLAIGGQMREAGARLSQLQLGQARQTQQQVLDALKQLSESLSTRRDIELARNLAALRQAASELHSLAQRGAGVEVDVASVAKQAGEKRRHELERLNRELDDLSRRGQQLARQLERLHAPRAARALQQAAVSSAGAAEAASAGRAPDAEQLAQNGRRRLEEAEQQLAQAIREAEEELAREELAQVGQLIAGIAARQRNVISETERIDVGRGADRRLDTGQTSAIKNAAAEQRLLAEETEQLRRSIADAAVFAFALEMAGSQMRQAGLLLVRGETAKATQDAERAALARLEQILVALKTEEPRMTGQDAAGDEQPRPQAEAGDSAGMTAELKLVRLLQQAINDRTARLEAARQQAGTLKSDEQQELDTLSREQGRVADIVLGLIQAKRRSEDDSEVINRGQRTEDRGQGELRAARVEGQRDAQKPEGKGRSLDQQLQDELDRELLKGLPGAAKPGIAAPDEKDAGAKEDAANAESQNPLANIARHMRNVEKRIGRYDTSAATQEEQRRIVSELEALLQQAGNSAGNQQGGRGNGSTQAGSGTGEATAGPPRDSTNRIERGTKEQAETADVKDVLRRMWGHLPDKLRDEMQASVSEQFLPKYERLIEEYYKRLSEQRPGP
jgi:hypothetical protein